jgi:hypothetical protein
MVAQDTNEYQSLSLCLVKNGYDILEVPYPGNSLSGSLQVINLGVVQKTQFDQCLHEAGEALEKQGIA